MSLYIDPLDARPYKRNTGIEREKKKRKERKGKEETQNEVKREGEKSLDLSEQ